MGRTETEYQKLVAEYERAVEEYTRAVHAIAAANSSLAFNQTMATLNVAHAKCEDLRTRLYEARKKANSN